VASGTVKWFSDLAGFGYITPDAGGSDLYAHHSAIVGQGRASLQEAQRVTYDAASGPKGPMAVNISLK
jgi:CspA family cold shock protein